MEKILKKYKVGEIIGEKYEVVNVLGGGMGNVYICRTISNDSYIVLKTLQTQYIFSKRGMNSFKREAYIWMKLEDHPNIVKAIAFDVIEMLPYIVLEYIAPDEGGRNTLTQYLKFPLDIKQILIWAIQFCDGMDYALSNEVTPHRDIKPDNIMITNNGILKITDFGLAKIFDQEEDNTEEQNILEAFFSKSSPNVSFIHSKQGGGVVGTLPWMAPEQFDGKADLRSDIYSFGLVLYQMLNNGKHPFERPNNPFVKGALIFEKLHKEEQIEEIDSILFPIIKKCVEKNPLDRYQTFKEMRNDLAALYANETGEEAPLPPRKEDLLGTEVTRKGDSMLQLGSIDEAIDEYQKALSINPYNDDAYFGLGNTYQAKNLEEEAIKNYKEAIRINPEHLDALLNTGKLLLKKDQVDEAYKYFIKALEVNSNHFDVHNLIGHALSRKKRLDESLQAYDNALACTSDNIKTCSAYYNKGNVYLEKQELRNAIIEFQQFLDIAPYGHPNIEEVKELIFKIKSLLPPVVNPLDFQYGYDEQVFEYMTRYFVPVDLTTLRALIPNNETILSSLITGGYYSETVNKQTRTWNWTTHVIITKNGIAYKNRFNNENFYYWNKDKFKRFSTSKLKIFGETLFIDKWVKKKDIYPDQTYEILRKNFGTFCGLINKNYKGFLSEMKQYSKTGEGLQERISSKGFNVFINECYTFSWAGHTKKAIKVAENAYPLISSFEEKRYLLFFHAACLESLRDYLGAIAMYDVVLQLNSEDSTAKKLKEKAQYLYDRHQIPDSKINKANTICSEGVTMQKSGKYTKAIGQFQSALKIDPFNYTAWKSLIKTLRYVGQFEESQRCQSLSEQRSAPELMIETETLKRLQEAEKFYEAAQNAHIKKGQHVKSLDYFTNALMLNPFHFDAWIRKGMQFSYFRDGNFKQLLDNNLEHLTYANLTLEAIQCFDEALKIEPNDVFALRYKGELLCDLLRFKEALEISNKLDALKSETNNDKLFKTRILCGLGDFEEAYKILESINISSYYLLPLYNPIKAETLIGLNRFEEAIQLLSNNKSLFALYRMGTAYEKIGNINMAVQYYQRALEHNPTHPRAFNAMERLSVYFQR